MEPNYLPKQVFEIARKALVVHGAKTIEQHIIKNKLQKKLDELKGKEIIVQSPTGKRATLKPGKLDDLRKKYYELASLYTTVSKMPMSMKKLELMNKLKRQMRYYETLQRSILRNIVDEDEIRKTTFIRRLITKMINRLPEAFGGGKQ
ncbi:MAG: hypothetical protein P3W91_003180 [Fervidobacterium sp.]|nr:hypothetical protein [Fervidobacterium sp.]